MVMLNLNRRSKPYHFFAAQKKLQGFSIMKRAMIVCALLATGCKNMTPETELIVDKQSYTMSRSEIITATNECESAGMRAVVVNAKRKVGEQYIPVVIDITCVPKFK